MEKSIIVAIVLLVCLPFFSETAFYKPKESTIKFTIVIDAGHGGKDSGALGTNAKEKDIALKLALRLGHYINQYMPNVRVLYTRTTDQFIPLHQRIAMANTNNADLFFSIHCNSMLTPTNSVGGTETYVMGLHRATENLNVAKRENKAILLEQDYTTNYEGYDPNSSEGHIMLSMYQNAYLSQSLLLAGKVEQQFQHTAKRKSRGVKQAGFLVLRAATMPSVLVEAGFLSNTLEENYLNSEKGQVYIASAMYRALKEYKRDVESKTNYNYQVVEGRSASSVSTQTIPPSKKITNSTHSFVPKSIPRRATTNSYSINNPNDRIVYSPAQKTKEPEVKVMPSIEQMYPTTLQGASNNKKHSIDNTSTVFRIQLAASTQKSSVNTGVWTKIKGVECVKVGASYKYLVGKHASFSTAIERQNYWRKNGFKDAFVVAFKNGQKISITEAKR
ncbi:N-acetylmuramoyl-L-alanine amidase family protein [Aureispira anguillae]|uniref:N-acetylmuramoyl-L-alanine amidase n=1 Tax=Aureispira anguillae TaxID=2864201 RepID=A0A916DVL3_9BACT|nr:N-acetylmuramoyl-L-alanine amidase [Aureispira anguillae]BDS13241.1 N-acetylmuramoyl-L-alanine amidase [Aureispira anguillae]